MVGAKDNYREEYFGNEGDDWIWGGWDIIDAGDTAFTALEIHGGSGDDTIYGGKNVAGVTKIYGEGGSDTIRTDWYTGDLA